MPFKFRPLEGMPEIIVIETPRFPDERGWLTETYKRSEFEEQRIDVNFVQDNLVMSTTKGILRGLHFQKEPMGQGKLVRCILGEIFDVAVDIRKGSPTYTKWVSTTLSADDNAMIWVPPGFAHGLQTTSDTAEVIYKITTEYSPDHYRCVRWDDPAIGIKWPLTNPLVSEKDAQAPFLKDVDNNFVWKQE